MGGVAVAHSPLALGFREGTGPSFPQAPGAVWPQAVALTRILGWGLGRPDGSRPGPAPAAGFSWWLRVTGLGRVCVCRVRPTQGRSRFQ